ACRVDQAVDPAVSAADVGDDAEPIKLFGDVERVRGALAARQIAGDGACALGTGGLGHRLADRAGRTGDQNDLVLEPVHPSVVLMVVFVVIVVVMIVVVVVPVVMTMVMMMMSMIVV